MLMFQWMRWKNLQREWLKGWSLIEMWKTLFDGLLRNYSLLASLASVYFPPSTQHSSAFSLALGNNSTPNQDRSPHPTYSINLRVTQPLFPLTIRAISIISKGDDCTEGVKCSYPAGRSPFVCSQQSDRPSIQKSDRPYLIDSQQTRHIQQFDWSNHPNL